MPSPVHRDPPVEEEDDSISFGQRVGAALLGVILTGAGTVSVFVGSSEFGTVVTLVAGLGFMALAMNAVPFLSARFQDFELRMEWRRRRAALTTRLHDAEAKRLVEVLDSVGPRPDSVAVLEWLFFESRVTNQAIVSLSDGERLIPRPDAVVGEGLVEWIGRDGRTRIGLYAMSLRGVKASRAKEFANRFLAAFPRGRYDAALFVTHRGEHQWSRDVALRVTDELGVPVEVVEWTRATPGEPLRPAIDSLLDRLKPTDSDIIG